MSADNRTVRVLSLDGGGVRGLSSMIVLEYLVDLVEENLRSGPGDFPGGRKLLPSDIFDHVVGTSTGGLIAVMLVKLNMPASECIRVYKDLIPRIFGKRQFGSCIGGLGVPRYSDKPFKKCLEEVFAKYGKRPQGGRIKFLDDDNVDGNDSSCTIVCREISPSGRRLNQPAFLCSRGCGRVQRESEKNARYELWQACRATSAAPTFFSSVSLQGRTFIDGTFGNTNNPTRKAHFHFLSSVPGYRDSSVLWLNIGTGSPPPHSHNNPHSRRESVLTIIKRNWKDRLVPGALREARNILRDLQAIATDCDRVEEEMEDIISSRSNKQDIVFSRISPNNGVAEIELDDWRALSQIEALTNAYLQRVEVQQKLCAMAEALAAETLRRREPDTTAVPPDPGSDASRGQPPP